MTDRPILFSGPMVRPLLDGRKTQTRRVLKLPKKTASGGPIYERKDMGGWEPTINGGGGTYTIGKDGGRVPAPEMVGMWHRTTGVCFNAPYQRNDQLWVKEAFIVQEEQRVYDAAGFRVRICIDYPAGEGMAFDLYRRWVGPMLVDQQPQALRRRNKKSGMAALRPDRFMPRIASRLTLTVTDVRVQRVQEISEADAIAEGIFRWPMGFGIYEGDPAKHQTRSFDDAKNAYRFLWDSLNAKRGFGWDANPWVLAISFTVSKQNIDAMEGA